MISRCSNRLSAGWFPPSSRSISLTTASGRLPVSKPCILFENLGAKAKLPSGGAPYSQCANHPRNISCTGTPWVWGGRFRLRELSELCTHPIQIEYPGERSLSAFKRNLYIHRYTVHFYQTSIRDGSFRVNIDGDGTSRLEPIKAAVHSLLFFFLMSSKQNNNNSRGNRKQIVDIMMENLTVYGAVPNPSSDKLGPANILI